ncbi:methyltransferase domain-containing protein [Lacinutrix sp.]|uniref:class I SAM-dependent methyltransferase n=1 Tax=Lacinutrix sp. TaxID=1937692 RepID=UPI0025BEAAAC|nr:methyltransferase domain-containing protein [Lacinutrix sp.]
MEIKRKKFQGVLNILSFNRHFYVIGLSVLTLIIIGFLYFEWSRLLLWIIIIAFIYGLIIPLVVSAYVYDYSGYYNFNWLQKLDLEDTNAQLILNINAGFDETSFSLKEKFPLSNLQVFDFYNAKKHTEPAIVRARKVTIEYPNTQQINTDYIPLKDKCVDIIFLLSAAHEIRSNIEKVKFLKECHRVCKPNGKVIVVEHLRDLPNFFAFSIGFTHFFSKNTWNSVFKKAGFNNGTETKFTPFMSIFSFKP